jgi:hypothetical protein
MRTGGFGQRNLDELVATLPTAQRKLFETLRGRLKQFPLKESLDYNPLELEWNPIYTTVDGVEVLRVNFKWDFSVTVFIPNSKSSVLEEAPNLKPLLRDEENNTEGKHLRFLIAEEKDPLAICSLVGRLI